MPPIINTLRTCGATIVGFPVNDYYTGSEILVKIQAFSSHKISKYRLQISAIFHKRCPYSYEMDIFQFMKYSIKYQYPSDSN